MTPKDSWEMNTSQNELQVLNMVTPAWTAKKMQELTVLSTNSRVRKQKLKQRGVLLGEPEP
jgi:hypothetical protein